jgi:hypothetical protein
VRAPVIEAPAPEPPVIEPKPDLTNAPPPSPVAAAEVSNSGSSEIGDTIRDLFREIAWLLWLLLLLFLVVLAAMQVGRRSRR